MAWPAPTDYQENIQHPRTCFQDPDLRAGSVALTHHRLPRVSSGNFASVYEVRHGMQCWAVRCFLRQVSEQQRRYALLSQHLAGLRLPTSLVQFEYLSQGIRVRGQWYPIVKMEWVQGQLLHIFIERHLYDPKTLLHLADQWRGLVNGLRGNHLAHGDLQHGNVLVTPHGLYLVDYDAMFVPQLRGTQSPELGHPNYQHPRRSSVDYDEELDNFAALVIYTTLRALAVDPRLWQQFHTGENLILSATDYQAHHRSAALNRLKQSADTEVRKLAAHMERCCGGAVAHVPALETVLTTFVSGVSQPLGISTTPVIITATTPPTIPLTTARPSTQPWWQEAELTTRAAASPPVSPSIATAPPARSQPSPQRASTQNQPLSLPLRYSGWLPPSVTYWLFCMSVIGLVGVIVFVSLLLPRVTTSPKSIDEVNIPLEQPMGHSSEDGVVVLNEMPSHGSGSVEPTTGWSNTEALTGRTDDLIERLGDNSASWIQNPQTAIEEQTLAGPEDDASSEALQGKPHGPDPRLSPRSKAHRQSLGRRRIVPFQGSHSGRTEKDIEGDR